MSPTRRRFLAVAGALAFAAPALAQAPAAKRSRLIMLGTGGGAGPGNGSAKTGHLLLVDGVPYVIDCGYGTARQLGAAGVTLPAIKHVFLTRQSAETNADFANLLLLAWLNGLGEAIDTWGPPPLKRIIDLALHAYAEEIAARVAAEGRPPLQRFAWTHELTAAGQVLNDGRVRVTAAMIGAPSASPVFAYRFETPDRSIVFASAAKPAESLIALARGADVLIHPAYYEPAIERIVGRPAVDFPGRRNPDPAMARAHLVATGSTAEEAGRTAKAAGVKTLVLSQLQPADDKSIADQMWTAAARRAFPGRIVVARDLMEL